MHNSCTIILAAGKGTRLKSVKPKVLHEILGEPLVYYSIRLARNISDTIIGVIGHGREMVGPYLDQFSVKTVVQDPPLGTGHAILQTKDILTQINVSDVIILPGDMPLIDKASLEHLVDTYQRSQASIGVLTASLPDPFGYGRIIRDENGRVEGYKKDNKGNVVKTSLDEQALQNIASKTNGDYLRSINGEVDVDMIIEQLGRMHKSDIHERKISRLKERYQIPLGISLCFLLAWLIVGERRRGFDFSRWRKSS